MKQYKIGRNNTNDIMLSSMDVSGLHAIVTQLSSNVFLIEDKNSTNGTFLNGQRIKRTTFTKKDKIHIAKTPLDNSIFIRKNIQSPVKKSSNINKEIEITIIVRNLQNSNMCMKHILKLKENFKLIKVGQQLGLELPGQLQVC